MHKYYNILIINTKYIFYIFNTNFILLFTMIVQMMYNLYFFQSVMETFGK